MTASSTHTNASATTSATTMTPNRVRGLLFAVTGSACWGLSGTAAQVLFDRHHITAGWMTTMRMLGAGVLLMLIVRPAFPRRHWLRLALLAVLGLALVQLTYLGAIALTNAATATFIQYLSIPMIAAYEIAFAGRRLTAARAASLAVALVGISLLVLGGGDAGHLALSISLAGLVVGLLSALTAAYNTLASVPLIHALGPWTVMSWGMLLGGLGMAIWTPPWQVAATGDPLVVGALVAFVVLVGTVVAFGLYFMSLRHLTPTDAAIAVTVEPVTAAVASLLVLNVTLHPAQYVGGALIVAAVVLLQRAKV